MALCEAKVPYNMADLLLCCMPTFAANHFLKDVDKWKMPSKVFCSQAMVLMLKQCIFSGRENAALVKDLQGMNSRAVSPNELFKKLQVHCIPIDVYQFVNHAVLRISI